MRSLVVAVLASILWCAAGCTAPASGALRIVEPPEDETRAEIREGGAVLLRGRQVASVTGEGKVVASDGRLLAWLHADSIRLPGGAELPIQADRDGALYLPEQAQEDAGLAPISARIRADGTLEGSRLKKLEGAASAERRRMALLLLVMLANDLATR